MIQQTLETMTEKATRIAKEGGATYPETVAALLQPYEEQTCGGASLFAAVDGQILPFEAAVAKLRETPKFGPLFAPPGSRLDVREMSHEQFLAVRKTSPELFGLRPKR